MSTLASHIRAAALGPRPRPWKRRADWIGAEATLEVAYFIGHFWCMAEWDLSTNETHKRMFLLFVAEAVSHEQDPHA